MRKAAITVAYDNEFFARGKRVAALADAGKPIPSESVISFGDPADLVKNADACQAGSRQRCQSAA